MRILRYLLRHKIAVFMIVLMYLLQTCCDLALPKYTADIVDVGIQQSGISDGVCNQITKQSFDDLLVFVNGRDKDFVRECYSLNDAEIYSLNEIDVGNRERLNKIVGIPLIIIENKSSFLNSDAIMAKYRSGEATEDEISSYVLDISNSFVADGQESINQKAVLAVKSEYQKINIDTGKMQIDYLLKTGFMMLLFAFFAFLTHIIMNFFATYSATKIGMELRSKFFNKILTFSDAEINKFSSASLITRGTNDIQQIQNLCVMVLRTLISAPILAVGAIIMIANTSVSMSWIVVLAVVVVAIVCVALVAITMPKFKMMQKLIDKVNLIAREMLTGVAVIRAFNREDYEASRFGLANDKLMKTQLFTSRAMSLMMPTMMLVMNLTSVLIVWIGAQFVDLGTMQTGEVIAFITYATMIIAAFLILGLIAIMLPRANVAAQRVDEVIASPISIVEVDDVCDSKINENDDVRIDFDHVSFKYEDGIEDVLSDVSFSIVPGQVCAIIGSTGCGKSTIIKLLERFYDPSRGSIFLNGVDIKTLSLKKLRSCIGYVAQKPYLFSGTIKSNISCDNDSMSNQQIDDALEIAQAKSFVQQNSERIDLFISQGATNVSGGQRQRLAIARAIATDAKVLVFDDSFSALDYKTDFLLREQIRNRLSDKAVLIVAQRIATVMNADNIIVLDDGRIVGCGKHNELLNNCEQYKQIALSQLSSEELFGRDGE